MPAIRPASGLPRHLAIVFLLLGALALLPARLAAQSDVIRGQVTGVDGLPLPGVRVTATSLPGNVTRSAQTNERGGFQIVFPGAPGDYVMGYAVFGYAFKQFELKRIAEEDVLIADARLSPIQLDTMVVVAPMRERPDRNQRPEDVGGTERAVSGDQVPPGSQGDIAALAASLPGVVLVPGLDGQADGFSVLGLGSDQNSVTLNGLQTNANGLPRDAAVTSTLTTSPYDPARGGFSGANFNMSSRPGSNLRSRGMSLQATTPQVQWTDPAARALGNAYTSLSVGGLFSGPIRRNVSFYNVSYQLGRNSSDYATLLRAGTPALQTAGVATDSVARLVAILRGQGVPLTGSRDPASRLSDSGSLFGSVDFSPPSSSSGQSLGLTFNGSWRRQTALGGAATSLPSAAGDRTSWGGGLQARHSGYLGMVLSETSAGLNFSRDYDAVYADLPAGRVLVRSAFADGTSGLQNLAFGGSAGLGSSSSNANGTIQNSLSWFDNANKHRLKLTSELRLSGNTQHQASNRNGTYTYNSLDDLAAGRPASFTRSPTPRDRSTGLVAFALALGDSWRRTNDFQLQPGLRVEGGRFTARPAYNPLVAATFGVRNDRAPAPVSVSPRLGFSWTVGRSQEIAGYAGAARTPRALVRGGIGVYTNALSAGQIGSALDNTGLPDASRQITCVGDAVPSPSWPGYASGSAAIPDQCADGSTGSVFASTVPNVTLFARSYTTPRSVRSDLSWSGNVLGGRFSANVGGTYNLNLNQQRIFDLNFRDTPRFTLADDGRPVFVDAGSIVAATGAVASQDARISPSFARVTELRSDLRSTTAQLSLRLAPAPRGPTRFGWSLAYTFARSRSQTGGFASTAGSPLGVDWSPTVTSHQFNYSLRYNFFDAVSVSWNGSLRSGEPFTPGVSGDLNGDGYWNDRAFVYDPASSADPVLGAGMRSLLAAAPASTRRCLERQLGRIAERSSCRGPWTSGQSSVNISLDRAKFRMPQRGTLSFNLTNPLGAADLLVHGSHGLRGWGQSAFPDATLLYVRGFDAAARRYRYEVNPRFGASRPQFMTLRSPVILTASVRVDIGQTRERQLLEQQLAAQRRRGLQTAEAYFGLGSSMLAGSVPNPLATILGQQDSLGLTAAQADSVAAMNRRYTYRADSLWAPLQRYLTAIPGDADGDELNARYLSTRGAQVDMLARLGPAVRSLLTPPQRRRLPRYVASALDPRYLALIRGGTFTYLGGGGDAMPFYSTVAVMATGGGNMFIMRSSP